MVYMTFNSSCSYAGVANMLSQHNYTTNDRSIALDMKLPYLFAYEDGVYMAGPMLQTADWFNLYLNPIGFQMIETEVSADQIISYLMHQKTAMLGIQLEQGNKHAIVYTGNRNGKFYFLNNKWEQDPASERITFTEAELMKHIKEPIMIATLKQIPPREVDLSRKLSASISVIRQNLTEIQEVCRKKEPVGTLRSKMNTLFRPLLLDGITMLRLLEEMELADQFSAIQSRFLAALRQESTTVITLGDYVPVNELSVAAERYIQLIAKETETL